MSLLLQALQKAAKSREDGERELFDPTPGDGRRTCPGTDRRPNRRWDEIPPQPTRRPPRRRPPWCRPSRVPGIRSDGLCARALHDRRSSASPSGRHRATAPMFTCKWPTPCRTAALPLRHPMRHPLHRVAVASAPPPIRAARRSADCPRIPQPAANGCGSDRSRHGAGQQFAADETNRQRLRQPRSPTQPAPETQATTSAVPRQSPPKRRDRANCVASESAIAA